MDLESPFIGRSLYFEDLLERWEELRCVGVYGMRSVGKSRFVKQLLNLVSKHLSDNDYITAWIDVRNLQSLRQIYLTLSEKLNIPIMDDENDFRRAVLARISEIKQNLWIVLDNGEDVIDSDLNNDFIELCKQITNQNVKVKVIITSTSHLSCNTIYPGMGYYDIELSPLSLLESKELLQKSAPSVDYGIYLDKIAELCEGLPLALLMTGSELEQDEEGLLDPCDMVELLNKCRLKVLSQDLYPIQEIIGKLILSEGERRSIIYYIITTVNSWDHIDRFNPASYYVCLSQART